ncbi:MAG TPA: glycosyltransferase family 9 protein [Bryobacteraceae bacterium]|jgi:ADP-heptose:LPS heptosyltransferase
MATVLERLPEGARLAVIRLRSLGDCVLTTPALGLLKQYRPDLRIAVVVENRFRAVFEENPDIDYILPPSAREILGWRADLALNLHGGSRSMALTAASAARIRAGFGHHRYSVVYSHAIPIAQEILGEERTVHTAEHIASAMFWLGVPRTAVPRAKLCGTGWSEARNKPKLVLHPFASEPAKTWLADRFLAVAEELRGSNGLDPVFLAGPGDDVRPFAGFEIWNNAPLARVKSLMAGAHLFVGNDSGPAHMAAAFGVPVIALFGASDPSIWGPWRTPARVLTSPDGIAGIAVDRVLEAAQSIEVSA